MKAMAWKASVDLKVISCLNYLENFPVTVSFLMWLCQAICSLLKSQTLSSHKKLNNGQGLLFRLSLGY